MHDQITERPQSVAEIYLDYGADASECGASDFKVCDRGMCFKSRWQFTLGTELAVVLSHRAGHEGQQRVDAEAVVASCEAAGEGCFNVIALFVDLPDDQRASMREIGEQLAQGPEISTAVEA